MNWLADWKFAILFCYNYTLHFIINGRALLVKRKSFSVATGVMYYVCFNKIG